MGDTPTSNTYTYKVDVPSACRPYLWWNPPNNLPMCGVITHVSNPYSRNAWTTATQILPEVQEFTPSLSNTLDSCAHFCCTLRRLCTTAGQLFYDADKTCSRYLKEANGARGVRGIP